jgi:dCMP deaminase
MKNMAEAGISHLYIDHKGFDKDWARRRGESFATMSMRIAEKAGINVFVIYRKEQRFEVISKHIPDYTPRIEKPAQIELASEDFKTYVSRASAECKDEPFALALCKDESGAHVILRTDRHPAVGYTSETIESKEGKYSFILQPVSRILMIASLDGLKIEKLFSSRTPTSRELVNMIAAGIDTLQIGDQTKCRDEFGLIALKQLKDAKILNIF